jgi:tetratricopeptide (TPR) repeat protein
MRMILNQFLGRLSAIGLLVMVAGLAVQSPVRAVSPPPVAARVKASIPAEAQAAFVRSAQQLKRSEFKPALDTLDQVVRRYPQLAAAYLERGKFYREMAENIGAIDLPPSVVDSYALENLNRAIALQPNYVDAYAER